MTIIFTKDSLRASVEAATGGKVTVLYDDKGYPSYMVRIPKFNVEDVDPGSSMGTGVHPAFIVGGVEKSELFIGQYKATVVDGRALSLPGESPASYINYETAAGHCTSKGPGWHLMTNWEWAAVALWCLKNGFQPRGNTDYGRHHIQVHESGRRADGLAPGNQTGPGITLTGSGPASWRHDGTLAGISDMVGNIGEWQSGLAIYNGEIYMPDDNDWRDDSMLATGVFLDGTATGTAYIVGEPVLSTGLTNIISGDTNLYVNWSDMTADAGYESLPTAVKQKMQQACIAPFTDGDPLGTMWVKNNSTRWAVRGGHRGDNGSGLFALRLADDPVATTSYFLGFRPAFIQ